MKAAVFNPDGTGGIYDFTRENSGDFLNEAIGGIFTCVHLPSMLCDMWVHDEGLILGLESNPFGEILWGLEYPDYPQPIVGSVVLTGQADAGGYTQGLPEELLKGLVKSFHDFSECPQVDEELNAILEEGNSYDHK